MIRLESSKINPAAQYYTLAGGFAAAGFQQGRWRRRGRRDIRKFLCSPRSYRIITAHISFMNARQSHLLCLCFISASFLTISLLWFVSPLDIINFIKIFLTSLGSTNTGAPAVIRNPQSQRICLQNMMYNPGNDGIPSLQEAPRLLLVLL